MIAIDEGPVQQATTRRKMAEDPGLTEDAVPEPDRHRDYRAGRDDPHKQQPPPRPPRRQVQGNQEDRQRRTGLGDDRPGLGRIEAERPKPRGRDRAVHQQRVARRIDSSDQGRRQGNALQKRDQQDAQRKQRQQA